MKLATIKDAPGALNTNDKAMWVLGHNAAVETLDADAERVAASLREILNLCEIGDVDEDTEALGWGNAIKAARAALSASGVPPSAPAMPPRLLQSLARRNFRAPTDMDDLIAMAANIIAEDGFVIERLQAKLAAGVDASGPLHSCKNCAHLNKSSCEEPCAGCTVRWRSGVSDRWELASGVPLLDSKTACGEPPMPQSDRMDGQGEQR
jgi:hypothetical protein